MRRAHKRDVSVLAKWVAKERREVAAASKNKITAVRRPKDGDVRLTVFVVMRQLLASVYGEDSDIWENNQLWEIELATGETRTFPERDR